MITLRVGFAKRQAQIFTARRLPKSAKFDLHGRHYKMPVSKSVTWLQRKVFRIGTAHYNWPMSAHASQAFSILHCTDLEDLPLQIMINALVLDLVRDV